VVRLRNRVSFMADKYLLDNYGQDPEITHLIDTKTFYLKPINNPDGHNLYLNTAQSNRSTVRPEDDDNDVLWMKMLLMILTKWCILTMR